MNALRENDHAREEADNGVYTCVNVMFIELATRSDI